MLYDMLAQLDGSPIVRLNQAIAMSQVCGADAALAAVDEMADRLDGYHLFHATRAELLDAARRPRGGSDRQRAGAAADRQPGRAGSALRPSGPTRPRRQHRRSGGNTVGASTNIPDNTPSPESCPRPRWGGCHDGGGKRWRAAGSAAVLDH